MQSINSFINLLGKNYYSDFLINVNAETIDFDSYIVLVNYKGTYFYELNSDEILLKRKEVIIEIKEHYQQALNEIYAMMLSQDPSKLNSFLDLNIKTVKSHLNILKKDFYIDSNQSRYYSILDDNPIIHDLETVYQENLKNEEIGIDKKVIEIISNSDLKKNDSFYYLGFLYQRYKTLSFLPFSLFQIGHRFINELNKIKSLNSRTPKANQIENTNETYFQSFIKLLNNQLILQKSTVIGVMVDFKRFSQEIKSEVLNDIQNKGDNRNDYLDYLINEIEKQDYVKEADIRYVQKWLDKYNIKIEAIFNMKFYGNQIADYIDHHFMDMDNSSNKADKALIIQLDFLNFFCKHYSDELITYFNSKKEIKGIIKPSQPIVKSFKEEYLEAFCKEISNERDIYKSTFIQCYDFGIKSFTEFLKNEITENLLVLPSEKIKPYLNYVGDKIKKIPYFGTDKAVIDKWITKYNIVDIEFPFLENDDVNKLITNYINNHLWNDKERALMEEIQLDFFYYASMKEANDIISFMDKLSINETKSNRIIEKRSEINSTFNVFEKESELSSIFKSSDAFNTFNSLLDNFDINLSNVKKRGTQAKLNAIWGCPSSKKAIFKEHSELNEYVKYLNENLKTKYNSRTMSDGSKYHSSIKEWLNPAK